MGFPDFPMCFSEKDSNPFIIIHHHKDSELILPNSKTINSTSTKQAVDGNYASQIPEFDVKKRPQLNQDQDQEEKGENINSGFSFVSSLRKGVLDSPPDAAGKVQEEEEEEEGCKTPTRTEFKIPPQICPPAAPQKPKAVFSNASAAKRSRRRRLFLDYSSEIESLFPPGILADFGKKIKKAKI